MTLPMCHESSEPIELAWANAAEPLAWWAHPLVNRSDVWIQYLPLSSRTSDKKCITAPADHNRINGALHFNFGLFHFRGADQGHLIGLHAIGKENTCRWIALDIDRHDGDSANAEDNFRAARGWHSKLAGLGFRPLLLDSNGAGGYHVLVIFSTPVPSGTAFAFARSVISDYASFGLQFPPETIPKQSGLSVRCPYGSAWRLPGRHHTRNHWTRVWSGSAWLSGTEAINAILAVTGDDPALIPQRQIETANFGMERIAKQIGAGEWAILLQQGERQGARHSTLTRLCGHYLGHGILGAEVEEIALLWNTRNSPPLSEEEVLNTVRDLVARHAQHRGIFQSCTFRLPTK